MHDLTFYNYLSCCSPIALYREGTVVWNSNFYLDVMFVTLFIIDEKMYYNWFADVFAVNLKPRDVKTQLKLKLKWSMNLWAK